MRPFLPLLFLILGACGPEMEITPARGSSFGHFEVRVVSAKLEALDDPLTVQVGGIQAYRVVRDDRRTVRFTVQGSPEPGPQEVVVASRRGSVAGWQLIYQPPVDERIRRVVAFGASLTAGTQDATNTIHTQTHGPAAQVARAAGAHLSLPLVKDGYLPSLTLDDFDRATCKLNGKLIEMMVARAQDTLVPKIKDPDGNLHISWARVDPALEVRNVAIGGFKLGQVLHGAYSLWGTGMEHFVWNPMVDTVDFLFEPEEKMIDRVVAMRPTLVISTDLVVNDYNNVDLEKDGVPDVSVLTPVEDFKSALAGVLSRLDETGAEVFLASGPDVTLMSPYQDKVATLRAQGHSEARATGWREVIRQRIQAYNAELYAQVKHRPRFHVVDFHAKVREAFDVGLEAGGTRLSPAPFGGLTSLDGMHFSDTGYALLANEFIKSINAALNASVPLIDTAQVLEKDKNSVAWLRAEGFTCAGN